MPTRPMMESQATPVKRRFDENISTTRTNRAQTQPATRGRTGSRDQMLSD
jgi:hypothetical protein